MPFCVVSSFSFLLDFRTKTDSNLPSAAADKDEDDDSDAYNVDADKEMCSSLSLFGEIKPFSFGNQSCLLGDAFVSSKYDPAGVNFSDVKFLASVDRINNDRRASPERPDRLP